MSVPELDLSGRKFLVRDQAQEMRDAVETCPLFVIRVDDIPRGLWRIGGLEHGISGPGIVVPASMRFHIHRAELPDLPAVLNPRFEAAVLLFLAHF